MRTACNFRMSHPSVLLSQFIGVSNKAELNQILSVSLTGFENLQN